MLYQIHLLKPKGVQYNRFTNRWACPINIFHELQENISSLAEIIEPLFKEGKCIDAINVLIYLCSTHMLKLTINKVKKINFGVEHVKNKTNSTDTKTNV